MTKTIPLLQLSLLAGLAVGLSSCDTVSNAAGGVGDAVSGVASALDPTTWFGGGDDAAPPPTADNGQPPSTDTAANTTPDLSSLPAKPATTTAADQQATAQSLAADGAQASYSANALRAGTEASAAPPPAADLPPSAQVALNTPPSASAPPTAGGVTANDLPPTTEAAPSAQPSSGAPPAVGPGAAAPSAAAPPPTQTALAAPPPSALTQGTGAAAPSAVSPSAPPPSTTSAALAPIAAPPPGAEPAVPAVPARGSYRGSAVAMNSQAASDAALGFQASSAPPLDPSINQWVSAPVIARYRQTANGAGIAPVRVAAVPAKPGTGMGGPENMSGAVVANLDAISTGPAGTLAAMNGGVAPTAVVYFPGDGATLSAAARAQVRAAADQFKAMGGAGSIRVVGHASSRTANMPVEKHLEFIFNKSQARASAVAQELIHEGVPASKVLVESVGDSQPVYYESMPQGEEGNRRAEIFVQS